MTAILATLGAALAAAFTRPATTPGRDQLAHQLYRAWAPQQQPAAPLQERHMAPWRRQAKLVESLVEAERSLGATRARMVRDELRARNRAYGRASAEIGRLRGVEALLRARLAKVRALAETDWASDVDRITDPQRRGAVQACADELLALLDGDTVRISPASTPATVSGGQLLPGWQQGLRAAIATPDVDGSPSDLDTPETDRVPHVVIHGPSCEGGTPCRCEVSALAATLAEQWVGWHARARLALKFARDIGIGRDDAPHTPADEVLAGNARCDEQAADAAEPPSDTHSDDEDRQAAVRGATGTILKHRGLFSACSCDWIGDSYARHLAEKLHAAGALSDSSASRALNRVGTALDTRTLAGDRFIALDTVNALIDGRRPVDDKPGIPDDVAEQLPIGSVVHNPTSGALLCTAEGWVDRDQDLYELDPGERYRLLHVPAIGQSDGGRW